MTSDGKDNLNTYFGSTTYQYVIPFFQRSYVWTEENWQNFWDSIEDEYQRYTEQTKSEHFIGTIITRDISDTWRKNPKSIELVDGQQRITSVAILLKAIADEATNVNLKDYVNKLLLLKDKMGKVHHRILHSHVDREYFGKILDGKNLDELSEGSSNLVDAYHFFRRQLEYSDEELSTLVEVILNNLPIISIELDERDDEQEIFDTINSLGVRLTIGELLKNYIFREQELRPHYEPTWFATFEADEETINFWDETKSAGRVKRTNLEMLLYCFLIVETGKEVRLEKLYKRYKSYLADLSTEEKVIFLNRLRGYAQDYRDFPTVAELDEVTIDDREKRLFHVIENLEITTVYPLILMIYQHVQDRKERDRCCALLESYLMRRLIAGLTNKNYNRIFLSWIVTLRQQESISAPALAALMNASDNDSIRMPEDGEVRRGLHETYMYNKNAREVLFFIALSQLTTNSRQDVHKKLRSVSAYSVEHIMPKKWPEYWKKPGMTEQNKEERNWHLKRLGNLTLITGTMNSSLRNASWKKKRRKLTDYSDLPITKDYLMLEEWDEEAMHQRAEQLADVANEIWPTATV